MHYSDENDIIVKKVGTIIMINNMQDFIIAMENIENQGFIKTHRRGRTGIGKTLEDLLGIKENNIPGPDLTNVELKSARMHSKSMVTLTTQSPDIKRC